MKKYKLFLVIYVFAFFSCKNLMSDEEQIEYIIKSKKIDSYNNIHASVYVSDTIWFKLAEFADSLVEGYGPQSGISFYADSNNVPIINEFYSYDPVGIEELASYIMPSKFEIYDEMIKIDEKKDLSFKLITYSNEVYTVKNPYIADYKEINADINFHKNYDYFDEQTKTIADTFIHLLLEGKPLEAPDFFQGKIDMDHISKIQDLFLGTEWDKVIKNKGISQGKYNLWYLQRDFVKNTDTLSIKIHFDVNKSAEKIERVEYSYD